MSVVSEREPESEGILVIAVASPSANSHPVRVWASKWKSGVPTEGNVGAIDRAAGTSVSPGAITIFDVSVTGIPAAAPDNIGVVPAISAAVNDAAAILPLFMGVSPCCVEVESCGSRVES